MELSERNALVHRPPLVNESTSTINFGRLADRLTVWLSFGWTLIA